MMHNDYYCSVLHAQATNCIRHNWYSANWCTVGMYGCTILRISIRSKFIQCSIVATSIYGVGVILYCSPEVHHIDRFLFSKSLSAYQQMRCL